MRLLQWIRNRFYEHQFYKITALGDQLSMMDSTPHVCILHIHRQSDGWKYHFITGSYEITTPYKVIGMSVNIRDTSYILPPNEFVIQGNDLFSHTLTLWLCKHYLYIEPTTESTLTLIDTDVNIHQCARLVVENNLQNDIKSIS
jgi:hypothetical protein